MFHVLTPRQRHAHTNIHANCMQREGAQLLLHLLLSDVLPHGEFIACLPVVVVAVVGSVFGVLCYVAAVFVSFFPSFVSR